MTKTRFGHPRKMDLHLMPPVETPMAAPHIVPMGQHDPDPEMGVIFLLLGEKVRGIYFVFAVGIKYVNAFFNLPTWFHPYLEDIHWKQVVTIEEGELSARVTLHYIPTLNRYLYILSCIFTFGIMGLFSRWFPDPWLKLFSKRIYEINDSMIVENAPLMTNGFPLIPLQGQIWVRIYNTWNEITLFPLKNEPFHGQSTNVFNESTPAVMVQQLVYFDYRCTRYFWNPFTKYFSVASDWKDEQWRGENLKLKGAKPTHAALLSNLGLQASTAKERQQIFGNNLISIPQPTTLELLLNEVLHPFYVFQLFSVTIWMIDDYYYYATCILIISILSTTDTLIETKKNYARLKDMSTFSCNLNVYRSGQCTVFLNCIFRGYRG
jgi:cation-transporting ATPase 13A3/4/5